MRQRVTGSFNNQSFEFISVADTLPDVIRNAHDQLYAQFGIHTWHRGEVLCGRTSVRQVYGHIVFYPAEPN